jgi:hypothetical protein
VTARRGLRAAWASLPVLARVAVFTAARACGGAGGVDKRVSAVHVVPATIGYVAAPAARWHACLHRVHNHLLGYQQSYCTAHSVDHSCTVRACHVQSMALTWQQSWKGCCRGWVLALRPLLLCAMVLKRPQVWSTCPPGWCLLPSNVPSRMHCVRSLPLRQVMGRRQLLSLCLRQY